MSNLPSLIKRVRAVLLDFDGPVCALFAGYPAHDIASDLRAFLVKRGADLPEKLDRTRDPLDLLRWTELHRPDLLPAIEGMQELAERKAADSAKPTPYARETIMSSVASGRPVLIVSNNSEEAISYYLKKHDLLAHVTAVIGRPKGAPHKMKPHPQPIFSALGKIDKSQRHCVLIGDSSTDIEAARRAGVFSIGYAKNPDRIFALSDADAVIDTMRDISDTLKNSASS
ncbi:HAD family hydrolase [Actinomadura kijaniata]|uniref:HAD family hydrolase n=1 Tax=Actinomadura kijaniata TaxID=46161 RepID=UPI003F1AA035